MLSSATGFEGRVRSRSSAIGLKGRNCPLWPFSASRIAAWCRMEVDEVRTCSGCDQMAALRDGSFCCRACRLRAWRRQRRALRRQVCASCRLDFVPRRADAKFCSDACRFRAYRKRKAAARKRADLVARVRGTEGIALRA